MRDHSFSTVYIFFIFKQKTHFHEFTQVFSLKDLLKYIYLVEFATDTMVKETTIRSVTPQCPCELCKPKSTTVSFVKTEEEIQEKIKEIKKALVINKNDLSSYRRRKISADDDRSSARGIGLFGACMLCMFVSFIIIMDFKTLVHQGSVLWRKTSRSVSKRLRRKP